MSDRVALMNHGRIEQIGTAEDLYERPGQPVRRRVHRRIQHVSRRGAHEAGRAWFARAGGARFPLSSPTDAAPR